MLKVKNESNLVRDPVSKAIINTDETGYEAYLKKRNSIKSKNEQISQNTKNIELLKNDMSEIKEMLKLLIGKN